MKFDPDRHHRRSIRLRGYDYRQAGTYFVTICTHHRECTLGAIHNRKVNLSPIGQIAERCWCALPEHFTFVDLDAFVIMPNHLHGIINIKDRGSGTMTALDDARTLAPAKGTQAASLAALVQNFKSVSTRKINHLPKSAGTPVWQRGYYERVVRDQTELGRIRRYIEANPERWAGNA